VEDEHLRIVDAPQLVEKCRVATPPNWRPEEDTAVLPFISDKEAEKLADQGGLHKVSLYGDSALNSRCTARVNPKCWRMPILLVLTPPGHRPRQKAGLWQSS